VIKENSSINLNIIVALNFQSISQKYIININTLIIN